MSSAANWLIVGLLIASCIQDHEPGLPPQTEQAARVADEGLAAWRAARLPTTPMESSLAKLRINRPATIDEYELACPPELLGPSWSCLRWLTWDVPVVAVSPMLETDLLVEYQALHELLHAMVYRFGLRDEYDPAHTDVRVWAGPSGSRPNSAEQRAQRSLKRDYDAGGPL